MKFSVQTLETKSEIRTLNWIGGNLVDLAHGGRVYGLDGSVAPSGLYWGGVFDLCVVSPSGHFAALCQRLGTKGLILDLSHQPPVLLREINRSYYDAEVYEYPVAFVTHEGVELLVHCPDEYCRLEVEDVVTGNSMLNSEMSRQRKPADFFHSRLTISPSSRRMLSAGWIWHPFDTVALFDIQSVLARPTTLDLVTCPGLDDWNEVNSAAFVDDETLLISANSLKVTYGDGEGHEKACIRMLSLADGKTLHQFNFDLAAGVMMPLGGEHVATFYQHPKVFHIPTGELIASWPEIYSGSDTSSIVHHLQKSPAMAFDRKHNRFAVASGQEIVVISVLTE